MGVILCSGGRIFSCSDDIELLRLDAELFSEVRLLWAGSDLNKKIGQKVCYRLLQVPPKAIVTDLKNLDKAFKI